MLFTLFYFTAIGTASSQLNDKMALEVGYIRNGNEERGHLSNF
jgi:hypothetical protein